ncbi:MAG: hypothetical protein R6X34_12570 [Chloroflexota bacterium]
MNAIETYLQSDLFKGEQVDTRNAKQKKGAEQATLPRQAEMFSQRELAQFGVRTRPQMPLSAKTRIELALQAPRTEEEKERDLLHKSRW